MLELTVILQLNRVYMIWVERTCDLKLKGEISKIILLNGIQQSVQLLWTLVSLSILGMLRISASNSRMYIKSEYLIYILKKKHLNLQMLVLVKINSDRFQRSWIWDSEFNEW